MIKSNSSDPVLVRTRIALWTNTAIIVFVALWFFILPAVSVWRDAHDPALESGGIPRCVFQWHQHLTGRFTKWAQSRVTGKMGAHAGQYDIAATEWPAHSAMFYLLATEELQKAWERDHSLAPTAPAEYARGAIDAAATLLKDPVNATWVKNYWGDDYLNKENIFFRMMVINGLTARMQLTGDQGDADFLKQQADGLAREFDASPWGVIDDYPGEAYPVDIVPTIAGIQRIDRMLGTDHATSIAKAVRVLEDGALDPACDLPGYVVDMQTGRARQPARGIGMSMTLVWTPQLWPLRSASWYSDYVQKFWQEGPMLAGFREFRKAVALPDWQVEIDAGPVIAGYGTSASAFGIGAARAHGDLVRARMLEQQAIAAAWPLPNGSMPGARVLSTPDAPFTGETAMLFALTRASGQVKDELIQHHAELPETPPGALLSALELPRIPPASGRLPGFVVLFVGGGMLIGVLMLGAAVRRVLRTRRPLGHTTFTLWCVLMAGGIVGWFFHPGWTVAGFALAQIFPMRMPKPKPQKAPIAAQESPV